MKHVFLFMICLLFVSTLAAQKQHKIVFDFTKGDTASFTTMIRQLNNIVTATNGNAQLEVVCYGPGLNFIMTEKTTVKQKIEEFHGKFNVVFAACEASMQRQGITKSQLLPQVTTVPLASLEISAKQQEGWSYMKAGFTPTP